MSVETQKIRKKAQLARLAAKGKPGYAKMYASQPAQIKKGIEQRAARATRRAAIDAVQSAIVTAAGEAIDVFEGTGQLTTKGAK